VSPSTVFVLLVALTVSATLLVLVVALVWWIDRYDREPVHLVAMVFLWGASAAPLVSVAAVSAAAGLLAGIESTPTVGLFGVGVVSPLIEELAKGVGVLLVVIFSSKFDNPTDGVVYGTAAGLGFAVTENVIYGIGAGISLDHAPGIAVLIGSRTLLSAGIHALASAAFGGFVGHAVLTARTWGRVGWTVAGVAVAMTIHGSWNMALVIFGPTSENGAPRPWLAVVAVLYLLYAVTLGLFLHSEHRILRRQLAEEVERGFLPAWVLDVIPYYRRRIRRDWWPIRGERTVIARLLTRMAFRKHALQYLPPAEASIASLEVVRLRQRLRKILGPIPSDDGEDHELDVRLD
jgi:RsiW-degrading membrane proteinase PrsW (M82 family)